MSFVSFVFFFLSFFYVFCLFCFLYSMFRFFFIISLLFLWYFVFLGFTFVRILSFSYICFSSSFFVALFFRLSLLLFFSPLPSHSFLPLAVFVFLVLSYLLFSLFCCTFTSPFFIIFLIPSLLFSLFIILILFFRFSLYSFPIFFHPFPFILHSSFFIFSFSSSSPLTTVLLISPPSALSTFYVSPYFFRLSFTPPFVSLLSFCLINFFFSLFSLFFRWITSPPYLFPPLFLIFSPSSFSSPLRYSFSHLILPSLSFLPPPYAFPPVFLTPFPSSLYSSPLFPCIFPSLFLAPFSYTLYTFPSLFFLSQFLNFVLESAPSFQITWKARRKKIAGILIICQSSPWHFEDPNILRCYFEGNETVCVWWSCRRMNAIMFLWTECWGVVFFMFMQHVATSF